MRQQDRHHTEDPVSKSQESVLSLAESLKQRGRMIEAVELLEYARERAPSTRVERLLAQYYRECGQLELCEVVLRSILRRSPEDIETLLMLAHLDIVTGNIQEARQIRTQLLEMGGPTLALLGLSIQLDAVRPLPDPSPSAKTREFWPGRFKTQPAPDTEPTSIIARPVTDVRPQIATPPSQNEPDYVLLENPVQVKSAPPADDWEGPGDDWIYDERAEGFVLDAYMEERDDAPRDAGRRPTLRREDFEGAPLDVTAHGLPRRTPPRFSPALVTLIWSVLIAAAVIFGVAWALGT